MAALRNGDCEGDKSQKAPKDALCSQTTLHLTSIKIGYTQRKQCLWDTNPISGPGGGGGGERKYHLSSLCWEEKRCLYISQTAASYSFKVQLDFGMISRFGSPRIQAALNASETSPNF